MLALFRSIRSFVVFGYRSGSSAGALATLILLLPCALASAQNTTISGTVYDPRTTASALALPNVLVYALPSGTAAPALPAGVQCLTISTPTGTVDSTTTAVDGTFTLNVPQNATYTVVIQAGKWRRQFPNEVVATTPLAGLVLNMPANHTQGDIPLIAIATGSVDALECVLLNMGIDPTEFTDDNGSTNPAGRIHLYKGSGSPGAAINASTPSETTLMGTASNAAILNGYDMVMFPCQGGAFTQSATAETNLYDYANAGGRVFTTHYSYVWLDPTAPYNSPFSGVANWNPNQAQPTPDPGVATVNTSFNDGATLAQWLQNAGASTTLGQIQLSTLRNDISSIIPPTQSWASMNSDKAIMQMTFNTPVGASAANQCGRVLFNDYHVIPGSGSLIFPNECTSYSGKMTAQEEMLEYALFDLSTFETPVVVPTLSIAFTPSPISVNQGDTTDQLTVNVTNTSSTTPVVSSALLTIAPPAYVTVTAMTDATGGWICTVSTLTCVRTSSLAASASDAVVLTLSVASYPAAGPAVNPGVLTATVSSSSFSNNVSGTDNVVYQVQPPIVWANPANIIYGTPLSATQLDATSALPGTFTYAPVAGTVLPIGPNTLTATFTPTDTVHYTTATAKVTVTVIPATPVVALTASSNSTFSSNTVTFTAVISSAGVPPTGTAVFYDGTTQIGTVSVTAGVATLTTSTLTSGSRSITVVYSGDTNYGSATSNAITETIVDFTIAPAVNGGGFLTVKPGTLADFSLAITPVGASTLPGAVTFAVTGLSYGATAVFNPTTLAAGSLTSIVSLQVSLPTSGMAHPPQRPFGSPALPVALALGLLPFARRLRKTGRRWSQLVVIALVSTFLAVGVSGCGGSIKAENYALTVTATSGNLSHTTTLNLTIQ